MKNTRLETSRQERGLKQGLMNGAGIGANSATVAVYNAECAPARIRGGLVMMWEVFVAFGIMMGYIMGAACKSYARPFTSNDPV